MNLRCWISASEKLELPFIKMINSVRKAGREMEAVATTTQILNMLSLMALRHLSSQEGH